MATTGAPGETGKNVATVCNNPHRFNRSSYVLKLVNLRESEQAALSVRDAETRLLQHKRVVQDLEQRFRQVCPVSMTRAIQGVAL